MPTLRTLRLLASGALLLSIALPAAAATAPEDCSSPLGRALIENYVDQIMFMTLAELYGETAVASCVGDDTIALCLAPDTPKEQVDAILRRLPTWTGEDGDRYLLGGRWTNTASGYFPLNGEPIILTYSFVPDGLIITGGAGEPTSASILHARMNALFATEAEWKQIFADCFADWGGHVGVTYVPEGDDGANWLSSPGILGVRGDVRIGGHHIDGVNNVLAYNYFPNSGGDMVLDTDENWGNSNADYRFFRNVVMHEHGHCLGLQHVTPLSCQKLMEANLCTNFLGPQDDDIRGASRLYGDPYEPNDSYDLATDLGFFTGTQIFNDFCLPDTNDEDWLSITAPAPIRLDAILQPVGSYYYLGTTPIWTNQIMDLGLELRDGATGENILLDVNDTGLGGLEVITDYLLPAGTFYLRVKRISGTDVQRYRISVTLDYDDLTAVEGPTPAGNLGLSVYPNPFNPKTSIRFLAPSAGPVSLEVLDLQGRLVRSFARSVDAAGPVTLSWDGRNADGGAMPSGVYFLRASAGGLSQYARGVLLK